MLQSSAYRQNLCPRLSSSLSSSSSRMFDNSGDTVHLAEFPPLADSSPLLSSSLPVGIFGSVAALACRLCAAPLVPSARRGLPGRRTSPNRCPRPIAFLLLRSFALPSLLDARCVQGESRNSTPKSLAQIAVSLPDATPAGSPGPLPSGCPIVASLRL